MIPKVIHYCWFGGNHLPDRAIKCIDSWKKYCPDYKIIEWNEDNYFFDNCNYVKQAYEAKKWAFVSDYVRFDILYRYGGVYFDTDVELVQPIDRILENGPFMGCEVSNIKNTISVAPGLGLAAEPGNDLYKMVLEDYNKADFLKENECGNYITVVTRVTNILSTYGLRPVNEVQQVMGIMIYPSQYFCPLDYTTGKLMITENTYSIHWYMASWMGKLDKIIIKIEQRFAGTGKYGHIIERALSLPFRTINKIKKIGIIETVNLISKKLQE